MKRTMATATDVYLSQRCKQSARATHLPGSVVRAYESRPEGGDIDARVSSEVLAGLEHEDFDPRVLGQAVGHDKAGGSASDDDVVG